MKVSAYFSFILVLIGAINLCVVGSFGFNPLEYLFGDGSFIVRALYVAMGVAANFLIAFAIIFRPFRRLK